jgi:hypothetical protein
MAKLKIEDFYRGMLPVLEKGFTVDDCLNDMIDRQFPEVSEEFRVEIEDLIDRLFYRYDMPLPDGFIGFTTHCILSLLSLKDLAPTAPRRRVEFRTLATEAHKEDIVESFDEVQPKLLIALVAGIRDLIRFFKIENNPVFIKELFLDLLYVVHEHDPSGHVGQA